MALESTWLALLNFTYPLCALQGWRTPCGGPGLSFYHVNYWDRTWSGLSSYPLSYFASSRLALRYNHVIYVYPHVQVTAEARREAVRSPEAAVRGDLPDVGIGNSILVFYRQE